MREDTVKEKEDMEGTKERRESTGRGTNEEMQERSNTCQLREALENAQFSQDKYSKC